MKSHIKTVPGVGEKMMGIGSRPFLKAKFLLQIPPITAKLKGQAVPDDGTPHGIVRSTAIPALLL